MYVCINFYEGPLINIKFYCDHFINLRSKISCWKMVKENFLSKDTIMNKRVYTCILIRRSPLGLQRNRFFVKLSWTFLTSSRSFRILASGSNSQICFPTQLLRLYNHGPCPSIILSFHILHICEPRVKRRRQFLTHPGHCLQYSFVFCKVEGQLLSKGNLCFDGPICEIYGFWNPCL